MWDVKVCRRREGERRSWRWIVCVWVSLCLGGREEKERRKGKGKGRGGKGGEERTLSALPVIARCSEAGLYATERISRLWASIFEVGSWAVRVSHLEEPLRLE